MNLEALSHDVYFTLKDNSAAQQKKMLEECYTYLKDHPGVLFFAAGLRGSEFNRPVNDQTFDVILHVVFSSKKAHDEYQIHPRHKEFIERNKPNWAQIRVFDAYVQAH